MPSSPSSLAMETKCFSIFPSHPLETNGMRERVKPTSAVPSIGGYIQSLEMGSNDSPEVGRPCSVVFMPKSHHRDRHYTDNTVNKMILIP